MVDPLSDLCIDFLGALGVLGGSRAGVGPVHIQLILVPSGFSQEAKIDAKDAA